MKKFSIAAVSLAAMTGLVFAQAKTGSGAGSAAPAKAGGAGSAAAAKGSAAAAPKMEMPKPPPEIAAAMKQMGARQTCTGTGMGGPDMKTEMKYKGTMTNKVTLDGWFIQMDMTGTIGEGKTAMKMKGTGFMTYDPKMAKWRMVGIMNDGSTSAGTADMANGKWESMSDGWGGMMGAGKFREHGDFSDPKAGFKMTGEASMDGGKTWTKVYESTCKK